MKSFKDLNIDADEGRFVGKKISIDDIIGESIVVQDYKIEPSLYKEKGSGLRATLQIIYQDKHRIIWTNSVILKETLDKVREIEGFPFETNITGSMKQGYRFN